MESSSQVSILSSLVQMLVHAQRDILASQKGLLQFRACKNESPSEDMDNFFSWERLSQIQSWQENAVDQLQSVASGMYECLQAQKSVYSTLNTSVPVNSLSLISPPASSPLVATLEEWETLKQKHLHAEEYYRLSKNFYRWRGLVIQNREFRLRTKYNQLDKICKGFHRIQCYLAKLFSDRIEMEKRRTHLIQWRAWAQAKANASVRKGRHLVSANTIIKFVWKMEKSNLSKIFFIKWRSEYWRKKWQNHISLMNATMKVSAVVNEKDVIHSGKSMSLALYLALSQRNSFQRALHEAQEYSQETQMKLTEEKKNHSMQLRMMWKNLEKNEDAVYQLCMVKASKSLPTCSSCTLRTLGDSLQKNIFEWCQKGSSLCILFITKKWELWEQVLDEKSYSMELLYYEQCHRIHVLEKESTASETRIQEVDKQMMAEKVLYEQSILKWKGECTNLYQECYKIERKLQVVNEDEDSNLMHIAQNEPQTFRVEVDTDKILINFQGVIKRIMKGISQWSVESMTHEFEILRYNEMLSRDRLVIESLLHFAHSTKWWYRFLAFSQRQASEHHFIGVLRSWKRIQQRQLLWPSYHRWQKHVLIQEVSRQKEKKENFIRDNHINTSHSVCSNDKISAVDLLSKRSSLERIMIQHTSQLTRANLELSHMLQNERKQQDALEVILDKFWAHISLLNEFLINHFNQLVALYSQYFQYQSSVYTSPISFSKSI